MNNELIYKPIILDYNTGNLIPGNFLIKSRTPNFAITEGKKFIKNLTERERKAILGTSCGELSDVMFYSEDNPIIVV